MTKQSPDFLDLEREALVELVPVFEKALGLRQEGNEKKAEQLLRVILKVEPRLAEPRMEIAHIATSRGDREEAEEQLRFAIDVLRSHGQWTLDLEPDALMSYALNFLGEVVISAFDDADSDEIDDAFIEIWNEAAGLFAEATKLDPKNQDAAANAARVRRIAEGTDA